MPALAAGRLAPPMPSSVPGLRPAAVGEDGTLLLRDRFTRPDSTTTLGRAETGQLWTPGFGTWGVASGRAKCITAVNGNSVWVDALTPDGTLAGVLNGIVNSSTDYHAPELVARFIDNNNCLRLQVRAGGLAIIKVDGGSSTTLASGSVATPDLADIPVQWLLEGPLLVAFVGGVALRHTLSAANSKFVAPTKHGLRLATAGAPASAAARWWNFEFRRAA